MNDNPENKDEPVEGTGSFFARKTLVVGLTGGVATGKTTVAHMLKELGAKVLSADEIVHRLLKPGTEVWKRVRREFPEVVCQDGSVDRSKLADVVFQDAEKRAELEAIVHPPVLDYLQEQADAFRKHGEGMLLLEIPLLIETGTLGLVDKVLVVTAEQESQISRLEKRYGINRAAAMARISSQLPLAEKVRYADWVISTKGTLASTKKEVERVWCEIQELLA